VAHLPAFRYHPDPLATGSIVPSDAVCRVCGQSRGYIYTGPVYADEDLDNALCPWCIADGSAARRFTAEFVDAAGVGDHGSWDQVSPAVIDTVSRKTPGFTGWQQESWWTHCADAAAYLGAAGYRELSGGRWASALPTIRAHSQMSTEEQWQHYLKAMDRDSGPTAYVFQCLHCGQLGGYSDCT
jgi:uncharacterized protein CbrC (UPF0167 family)